MTSQNNQNEPSGAFKAFPSEKQPDPIPLDEFNELSRKVYIKFADLGELFIPSPHLKNVTGKTETKDMDIIIFPHRPDTWKQSIISDPSVIAYIYNGPQVMTVVCIGEHKFMLDFIHADSQDSFDWKKFYHGYGTILPAVFGAFARSLGYKFGSEGLFARIQDSKRNYHNMLLTKKPGIALAILGIRPSVPEILNLYNPEDVATAVCASPYFDSAKWHKPPQTDGQTIVTKNRKAHSAAKKKPEVIKAFAIIDKITRAPWKVNEDFEVEREILGDEYIDRILEEVNSKIAAKEDAAVTGDEIVKYLGLKPGPVVGMVKSYIRNEQMSRADALEWLKKQT